MKTKKTDRLKKEKIRNKKSLRNININITFKILKPLFVK